MAGSGGCGLSVRGARGSQGEPGGARGNWGSVDLVACHIFVDSFQFCPARILKREKAR